MARTKSSAGWLSRHVSDPYVKQAQKDGYRARSAYKLIELNEKDRLIRPGMRILDLGSAPGGWSQVAGKLVGTRGRVLDHAHLHVGERAAGREELDGVAPAFASSRIQRNRLRTTNSTLAGRSASRRMKYGYQAVP